MFKQKESSIVTIVGGMKGGSGKSTVTNMIAATLASDYAMQSIGFEKGFKVLVIDSDYQGSIYHQRQAELGEVIIPDSDIYDTVCVDVKKIQELLDREELKLIAKDVNGGKYYDIVWESEDDFKNKSKKIEQQFLQHYDGGQILENYDFVFFDLVGSIQKDSDVRRAYIYADNLIVPIRPSRYDVRSFMKFIKFIQTVVTTRQNVGEQYTTNVVSFVNGNKNTTDSKIFCDVIKDLVEGNDFLYSHSSLGDRATFASISSMDSLFDYFVLEKYREFRKNRTDPKSRFRKNDIHEYTSFFLSLCPYFFDVIKGEEIKPFQGESLAEGKTNKESQE